MLEVRSALRVHRLGRVWELDYSAVRELRLFRHKASHSCFAVEAENNRSKLEKSQLSTLNAGYKEKALVCHKGSALIYVRSHVRHY